MKIDINDIWHFADARNDGPATSGDDTGDKNRAKAKAKKRRLKNKAKEKGNHERSKR